MYRRKVAGIYRARSSTPGPLVHRRNRIGDAPLFSWLFANRIRCLWSSSSGTRILHIEYSTDTFQRASDVNQRDGRAHTHTHAHGPSRRFGECSLRYRAIFVLQIIPRAARFRRFAVIIVKKKTDLKKNGEHSWKACKETVFIPIFYSISIAVMFIVANYFEHFNYLLFYVF